jgi:hypothetical protein
LKPIATFGTWMLSPTQNHLRAVITHGTNLLGERNGLPTGSPAHGTIVDHRNAEQYYGHPSCHAPDGSNAVFDPTTRAISEWVYLGNLQIIDLRRLSRVDPLIPNVIPHFPGSG